MENHRENDVIEVDLLEIINALLGRFWLILGGGLLAAAVGFAVSKFVLTPTYESTTKIYILNKSESTTVTYSDVQMGTQLTKDYAELINSRYVLEEVIEKLSLAETEYQDLLNKVSVHTPTDTRIVSITVTDTSPRQAMDIANCIREVAGEHIQNVMDIDGEFTSTWWRKPICRRTRPAPVFPSGRCLAEFWACFWSAWPFWYIIFWTIRSRPQKMWKSIWASAHWH